VNTGSSWRYDRERLDEALASWKASGPDEVIQAELNEALMDLIQDPLRWGTEDPTVPGVFHRSVKTVLSVNIGERPIEWVREVAEVSGQRAFSW